MARIRTIKPDFWTDGTMIALPYEARLFYIGMWNHACDRGHLPDDPFGLKLKVLPADPVDGSELVALLVDAGRVVRVSLPDGRGFLVIPRFSDHQRVDTRWNSRCPVCTHLDSSDLAETHASFSEGAEMPPELGKSETRVSLHKLAPGGERKGKEGKGEGGADATLSPFCSNHPNGTEAACRPCGTARTAFGLAQSEKKSKPAPRPFTVTADAFCENGKHTTVADGTCTRCTYRPD